MRLKGSRRVAAPWRIRPLPDRMGIRTRRGVPHWLTLLGPSVGPGLLMIGIALIQAGRPVLSWDEIATADAATRTPAQLWHLIHQVDAVFGAYYLFIHYWTALAGTSEIALRLPSILAMGTAVALTGELGRRYFGPLTGTVAGLLLCLMPNTSRYAAEARPYAFACFFALLALLLLHRAVHQPRPARWIAYGTTVLLLGLSHVIALTTLAAHLVVIAQHRTRRILIAWGTTVGCALAALTPLLWLGLHERDTQLFWVKPLTPGALLGLPGMLLGSVPAGWLLIGLAILAVWQPRRHVTELTVMALVPVAVLATLSVLVAPYWVVRYLLIVLAPLALLAAAGLVQPFGPGPAPAAPVQPTGAGYSSAGWRSRCTVALQLVTALAVLGLAVLPDQRAVRGATAKIGSDYRTAAQLVGRFQEPGDGIIYTARSRTMRTGLEYYLRHDPGRPRDLLLQRSAADVGTLLAEEYSDPGEHLGHATRIWLFAYGTEPDPAAARPDLRALRNRYQPLRIWTLHDATLALFLRQSGR
ncbi:glycosyltransferase family 39 protein [Krasilnikovia sp. MM14-A1259]|uniref:glycosyltransferase family 39 protein n=1 Tax=Krasilnikovia sp. MM14-A1259 TaxID=3373539 RepID=UPI00399C5728